MAVEVSFHHVGVSVTNLERYVEFLDDAFGVRPGMILEIAAGPVTAEALALPEHVQRVALVTIGAVVLELIEFHPMRRTEFDGRQDDAGYCYPCFAVRDIEAAYAELTAKGYHVNAKPQAAPEGPVGGSKFMILKDPEGRNIEIVETGENLVASHIHSLESTASFDEPIRLGRH
jgi:catechol 2,3-dioxygenase-like lactoylglutathione lyase family enzyme